MPVLTGSLSDVTGVELASTQVRQAFVKAPAARGSLASGNRLLVSSPVAVDTSGTVTLELEPGPAVMVIDTYAGGPDVYDLHVTEDMTLLSEAVAESAPAHQRSWAESQMVQLRGETVTAAAEADTAKGAAEDAASAAEGHRAHVDSIRETLDEAAQNNVAPYLTQSELNATYETQVAASEARAETATVVAGQSPTHLWWPPAQPAVPNLESWTAQQFIDRYETLRAANPEYVTREQIGLDAEAKPIWAYFFTPAAYENTVLAFNQHGYEKVAIWSTMVFAELLTDSWATDPLLAAFRAKTRLVVVPFLTWYGVDQTKRTNFNGVDLNRNWDWKWAQDPGTDPVQPTYKGTAPFSEPETQALRDFFTVLDAQGGLNAALDMHSVGYTIQPPVYYCYFGLPSIEILEDSWAAELGRELAPDPLPRYITSGNIPTAISWMQNQGVRTLTVEYYQQPETPVLDETNMRKAVRVYGNTIMRAASLPALRVKKANPGVIVRSFDYVAGVSGAPNVRAASGDQFTQPELEFLRHEFSPPCAGVILWQGQVLFGSGTAGRVWLRPVAGTDSTHSWWKTGAKDWDISYGDIVDNSTRLTLPFNIARPVTDSSGEIWPFRMALHASGNASYPPLILRYTGTMTFIPNGSSERFERWTASGRSEPGAMQFANRL